MPRQDVPYGGAICRLKERIAEIWDELGKKLHSINGVEGDAAGDVKIVSGDAAITISEDQVNHQITIGLDQAELPSAAVTSVNGRTGDVILHSSDIDADGGVSVQGAIDNLSTRVTANASAIASEQLARQNADSTLQTNINTISAGLPAAAAAAVAADPTIAQLTSDVSGLQAADANNVKLSGSQAITGNKTVPTEATGTYSQQIANSQKVKNELDNYAPMVRTTGNQSIAGLKNFTSSALAPHSGVRVDGVGWRKVYIDNSGFNHHNAIIAVIPRRISFGTGIIFAGGHNTAGVTCIWLNAGTIPNDHKGDFAISYDGTEAVIWQKATGSVDVYATEIITMGWNGNINLGVSWEVSTDDTIYTVDSTGYTDGNGITHTFTQWGVSS